MDAAAYLIKAALSGAEHELDTALDSAQDRAYRAALKLAQLQRVRDLHRSSKRSPWTTGLSAGIPAGLLGAVPGYMLGGGRGALIGAGIGGLLGGGAGAMLPYAARAGLSEMSQGQPGSFETQIAPSGMLQAFGDSDEVLVEARLKERNRRILRDLLK